MIPVYSPLGGYPAGVDAASRTAADVSKTALRRPC
jgi:hypothetical protein